MPKSTARVVAKQTKTAAVETTEVFFGKPHSKIATEYRANLKPVSIDLLKRLIKTSIETKELLLDLDGVRYLLSLNKRNRSLSEKRAKDYEAQMREGRFMRTGEVIIFTDTGIMNTGQHRLRAAELYGKPVWFNIAFGRDAEVFAHTDTGRPHSAADVLNLLGVRNYAITAATLRLLVLYQQGLPGSATRSVGPALIKEALDSFPDIVATTTLFMHYNFPNRGFRTAVLNAVTWLSIQTYGEARTKTFLQTLADGVTDKRDNPARQLRERLLRDERARIGQLERFALSIKALVAFMEKRPLTSLGWRAGGRSPEAFPLVPNSIAKVPTISENQNENQNV